MDEKTLYNNIKSLGSLSPSVEVDELFRQLVRLAETKDEILLTKEEIEEMQQISSQAEGLLEACYAKRICTADDAKKELTHFPYYKNYTELSELEVQNAALCSKGKALTSCLFVGGGPLPLTAIMLAEKYDMKVTVLEKNKDAAEISKEVLRALGLADKIEIICTDAATFDGYHAYELIFLAALVGETEKEKESLFSFIYEKSTLGTLFLLRSSFGGRLMLYKPWSVSFLRTFPLSLEVRPYQKICNSFFIIQKT